MCLTQHYVVRVSKDSGRNLTAQSSLSTEKSPSTGNFFKPLNAELNPICHLLALLGAHHILHISRIMVKSHTMRK